MIKQDLVKTFKGYYNAKTEPEITEFGLANYISIVGKGDPSGDAFVQDIQLLYPVAYQLKFDAKAVGNDFAVAKLEGLWWYDETQYSNISISEAPLKIPRSEWEYRLMIRIPDYISIGHVDAAVATVFAKKGFKRLQSVSHFQMQEGKCVQILHTGPFVDEPKTLTVMYEFIQKHQLKKNGLHHEIYLSDFRKTAPEKLRTILREPVK
jgi:hypothetical protein